MLILLALILKVNIILMLNSGSSLHNISEKNDPLSALHIILLNEQFIQHISH